MDKLFNPDYLRSLCVKYGLRPSRQYGQNFLVNSELIEKMLEAADIKKTDIVVEIGPGFGALTFALAERAKKVLAFEIEKKLAPYWEKYAMCHPERSEGSSKDSSASPQNDSKNPYNNIEIVWGNVLRQVDGPWTIDYGRSPIDRQSPAIDHRPSTIGHYKVIANLPYQITSPVIRVFLEAENPPDVIVLMVQKEVAERICAAKGDMSLLSVAVQYYAKPEIITNVPRSYFWPEPKVDSAVIKLEIRKQKSENRNFDEKFFKIVKAGFANRRKLLIKNLSAIVGKNKRGELVKMFAGLGLKETVRAQELDVAQWEKMAKLISNL